eukprot:5596726-Alexandrium_andersonii.AAC.1
MCIRDSLLAVRSIGHESASRALELEGELVVAGRGSPRCGALLDILRQASLFAYTWRGTGAGDCVKAAEAICAAARRTRLGPQAGAESDLGSGSLVDSPA